jgi:5'-deoxynucleotidase YfbR-like HD superfamily hydrolase
MGETYEAKIVKDLDKLEMIQQAFEYEKEHGIWLT